MQTEANPLSSNISRSALWSRWSRYYAGISLANSIASPRQMVFKWDTPVRRHGSYLIMINLIVEHIRMWGRRINRKPRTQNQDSDNFSRQSRQDYSVQEAISALEGADILNSLRNTSIENLQNGNFAMNTVESGDARNPVQTKYRGFKKI